MKLNLIIYSLVLFFLSGCSYNSVNNEVQNMKLFNWQEAGTTKIQKANLSEQTDSIIIPFPTDDPKLNLKNISKGIIKASKRKGITKVILRDGQYNVTSPIVFRPGLDRVILKGSGNSEIHFLGSAQKASSIIKVYGKTPNWKKAAPLIHYDDIMQRVKLEKKLPNVVIGDFIEIRLENGSWHDSENHKSWNPKNYVGTIVKIIDIDQQGLELTINQSILTEWEMVKLYGVKARAIKYNPVKEIGFENFKLSTNNINNRQGVNIDFYYAADCWVDNIESAYAASVHVNIANSTSIEVKNSTFHHAKDYGNKAVPKQKLIAGTGYGVNVSRSSNCLIENNIFYHLRHAMIIALGSNRNVFGYNHSYDQFSYPVKNLSDLNLHGHFPYNNLFEGNTVERIHADQWWGSNGPNNTFVNNTVAKGSIKLEKTNDAVLIGNKAELILIESKNVTNSDSLIYPTEDEITTKNRSSKRFIKSLYKKEIRKD